MSGWTDQRSVGRAEKENRWAKSLQYRPARMTRSTWGQWSRSKSMSQSQLVYPVKYLRLMASTITTTVQGFSFSRM